MQQLETRSDEELEKETRFKSAAQAILGTRAAERMDAAKAREHFRVAIAAARPQERMQLRRMAEASLALAERRAGDLKIATEKLGGTPPTNRQLLMLRIMGVDRPAAQRRASPRRVGGIALMVLAIVLLLVLGLGIVKLIALAVRRASATPRGSTASCSSSWCSAPRLRRAPPPGPRGPRPPENAPPRTAASGSSHFSGAARSMNVLPPFWTLVEKHGDELLAHARRLAGDAAEDVLQDALLRALRAYPRLRHADHLRAWLYRVTTSAAIDHHRARKREVVTDDPPTVAAHDTYDDGAFEALIAP